MRELAILTFVTVDGVMQAPKLPDEDTSGGFTQRGWAAPHWDAVMEQVRREAMAIPYEPLLGRKTYELFAANFPKLGGDHPLNKATKYVVTSTLNALEWKNSSRISGDIAEEISRLKDQDGPLLQVHGSAQLIQTLLAHDLIDEFRLWTFPVVVGSGKRLFGDGIAPKCLALVKSETGSSGVMMGIYRRAEER